MHLLRSQLHFLGVFHVLLGGRAIARPQSHGRSRCGKNRNATAECRQAFFSSVQESLGLDRSQYSNAVLAKIAYAGSNNTSYQQAHADLDNLAELEVSD